jgi:hypothetical protein
MSAIGLQTTTRVAPGGPVAVASLPRALCRCAARLRTRKIRVGGQNLRSAPQTALVQLLHARDATFGHRLLRGRGLLLRHRLIEFEPAGPSDTGRAVGAPRDPSPRLQVGLGELQLCERRLVRRPCVAEVGGFNDRERGAGRDGFAASFMDLANDATDSRRHLCDPVIGDLDLAGHLDGDRNRSLAHRFRS